MSNAKRQEQPGQFSAPMAESAEQRVQRLYKSEGGPLLGWLIDEAHNRGQTLQQMATELGVTYGYIAQLRNGLRSQSHISKEFAAACARYLGIPTVVVLLLCGYLDIRDFAVRAVAEDVLLDRAIRKMMRDPQLMLVLCGADLQSLTLDSKRMLVTLYSEFLGLDFVGGLQIPQVVTYLQRAAVIHNERELEQQA